MKKKKVGIIHTSLVSVQDLKDLFAEIVPEAELTNIIDDSLLRDVMANGSTTPAIVHRVCTYAKLLEDMGMDLIFNQCSSVGEAADVARKTIHTPYLKVDQAMAEKAVEIGKRISVVATVASTMGPSVRIVERAAADAGKSVEVRECLVDGALDILMKSGDREKHNKLVLEEIKRVENESDVIVLAQGSMLVLVPYLNDIKVPVLSSPRLGVERAREVLEGKSSA